MIEAPKFDIIKEHKYNYPTALCCIVFAPKFHTTGYHDIMGRIEYLNCRSDQYIQFYCAGYGAYWNELYAPDMEPLNIHSNTPWAFSQRFYASFVNEVENNTRREYSGGSELILLDANLDFSKCLIFYLDKLLKDNLITHINELIEELIRYAKSGYKIKDIQKALLKRSIVSSAHGIAKNILPEWSKTLIEKFQEGKHYIIKDLSSK